MNSENINNTSANSDEISLGELIIKIREWYHYFLSKWLVVVIFVIVGGGVGLVNAYLKKPEYTAITTFVLEEGGGGGISALGGLASMIGVDVGGGGGIFQGENILELYKSRIMIEKTLLTEVEYNGKKQLLVDRYIDFNKLRESWEKLELKNIKFERRDTEFTSKVSTRLQDSILGKIVEDINKNYMTVGKMDKKLNIISAQVKAKDEFFAKTFNEQIVKNVNDFYIQTKTKKSLQNVAILQQKTDSVRAVMNGAIYKGAIIADATPNLNPTRQIQRVVPMQRSQFSVETNKAILSELVRNLELSKISLSKEAPLIQVVDEPIMPLYKYQLGKKKAIAIGAFLGGFCGVLILIIRRLFKKIIV